MVREDPRGHVRPPTLSLPACAAALGVSGSALGADPPRRFRPAGRTPRSTSWARGGADTRLIYDRGRVQSVGGSALALLERDGSVVTIQVAPNAVVRLNGRRVTLDAIRPGDTARTLGTDGRPATKVVANRPRAAAAEAQVGPEAAVHSG